MIKVLFGYSPGVLLLKTDVSERFIGSIFSTWFSTSPQSYFITCWRWNRYGVPKRRSSITTRRLGNTQNNLYHHYNAAKAWNLECYCILPTLCLTSTLKINSPSYLPPERNRITNERWTDNSLYDANVLILIDPNNGGKMHDAHPIYLDAQRIWLSIFMWLSLWRRWFYMFRS